MIEVIAQYGINCPYCDHTAGTEDEVKRNWRYLMDRPDEPWTCERCQKTFNVIWTVIPHVKGVEE